MNKHLVFTLSMLVGSILLFLLRLTKMPIHIAVSVLMLAGIILFTVKTAKKWGKKEKIAQIAMRLCFGLALLSGILLMTPIAFAALGIIHKLCAVLFVILLIAANVKKAFVKEK